ncbi:MAG TPA: glycosyl transferase family 2, partial [Cyanobacteria bacterium UBA8543]|nr:glycosyl transferase family 2 [Cyanobacteria bacterium UBA8543]
MVEVKPKTQSELPSFSIIIETENLSIAEIDGLFRCLKTLAEQNISPTLANEVLIVESGDVTAELIKRIQSNYPWIQFRKIESDIGYYEAKMKGVALTTGEVIVLCDSDCTYEPIWLSNLLSPFANNPEIQIVAGETTTPAYGAYGIAIALSYIFPRFSRTEALSPASSYFCNNVAFRRSFLMQHPIPSELPIYRGNCTIHARNLSSEGYKIWRQPLSRATHAAPNGLSHFFWRFLLLGYDALAVKRIAANLPEIKRQTVKPLQDLICCLSIGFGKFKELAKRFYTVFAEDIRR